MNYQKLMNTIMAMLLVSSLMVGTFATPAMAEEDEDPTIGDRLDGCVDEASENVGWLTVVAGGADIAYYCAAGALDPDAVDDWSDSQLEDEAWVNAVSIQDSAEQRQDDFDVWGETAVTQSLQQAEASIIEAHYNDETEAVANSEAQEDIREYYTQQLAVEFKQHNEIIETALSSSRHTTEADGVDTIVTFDINRSGLNSDGTWSATDDSDIIYETIELPNGDEMDVAVGVLGGEYSHDDELDDYGILFFEQVDEDLNVEEYEDLDVYEDENIVETGEHIVGYDEAEDEWVEGEETNSATIEMHDPYDSDNTVRPNWFSEHSGHLYRLDSINDQRNEAADEVADMVSDLYETHETGTIDPDEYVSPATLVNEFDSDDSHYSYSTAMAASLGFETDVTSAQTITVDGEEYEGQVLVRGDDDGLDPIAIDTADTVLDVDDPFLEFDEDGEFIAGYEYPVEVDGVTGADADIDDDAMEVTIEEDDVTGDWVLIDAIAGPGDSVTQYLLWASEDVKDEHDNEIPTGLVSGETYDPSDFDTVMLSYQQGDTAAQMTLDDEFTVDELESAATGDEVSVVEYDDGVDRDFTDTSNLTEELERMGMIDEAFTERTDVDEPAGGGGDPVDRITDGLIGALFGGGIVVVIVLILVVLYLFGNVTRVA